MSLEFLELFKSIIDIYIYIFEIKSIIDIYLVKNIFMKSV